MRKLNKIPFEDMLYDLLQHDVVLLGEIHFRQVHADNELTIVRELVRASVVSSRKMQLSVEGIMGDWNYDLECADDDPKRRELYRKFQDKHSYFDRFLLPIVDLVLKNGFKIDTSITKTVKAGNAPANEPVESPKYVKIYNLNEMNDTFTYNLSALVSKEILTVAIVGKAHVMRKNYPEIGIQQKLPKKMPHISCIAVVFDDEDEPAGTYKEGQDYRVVGRIEA